MKNPLLKKAFSPDRFSWFDTATISAGTYIMETWQV